MRRLLIAFGLLAAIIAASAMPPPQLAATLDQRLADPALKGAKVGVFIQSLWDGDVWYARHECDLLIPASNAKLVTAALALEYLKPEYRYTTRLLADCAPRDGALNGDLYLQGGGDPSLSSADLLTMAQLLAAGDPERGIPPLREIRGRLILDDGFFPRSGALRGKGWELSDLPWYYAAPSSALSCNRNAVTVTVRGGVAGQRPEVTLTPPTGLFTVVNRALTRDNAAAGAVKVIPDGARVWVTGRIAPGGELTERLSVPQPARYLEEQFRLALRQCGVAVGGTKFGAADPQRQQTLVEHHSAPLGELVTTMLKGSDNHYAEQLRWTLLALYSREKPLDVRYAAMLQDFYHDSGLISREFTLVDGSGLSRLDRLSPVGVADMLDFMAEAPEFPLFFSALPVAGEDGTLEKRLLDTPAAGNAHAKTGTMTGVCALSGYVTTAGGERLVFSILLNGYRGKSTAARKLQDDIVSCLAGIP